MSTIKTNMNIIKGPYASTIDDNETTSKLTIDWSYEGLYFKYRDNSYITLSLGSKTPKYEIHKLDTQESVIIFIKLCHFALKELKGYSIASDNALDEMMKIISILQ